MLSILLLSAAPMVHAQPPRMPPPINGTVVALHGDELQLTTVEHGRVEVSLTPEARIIDQVPASLTEVKAGRFIGTTAVEGADGQLVAREIHIFPESMRGVGEGHYPMGPPDTTMTNGNVESVAGHVGVSTRGGQAMTLQVEYKGGQSTIRVPRHVTVTMMRPGTRALLRTGAHVTAFAQTGAGHTLSAGMLIVHAARAD